MNVLLIASTAYHNNIPGYQPADTGPVPWFADELAEEAGRLCYESWRRPNPKTATNNGYLANIIDKQHFSVLEHASATFYIDGVSRTFTHELIRHRHLSPSEVSQRYVDLTEYKLVIPPAMRGESYQEYNSGYYSEDDDLGDTYDLDGSDAMGMYETNMRVLQEEHGLSLKEARQAARFILPAGLETKILITGNHRAWRDVLSKRLSPQADLEFQLVAKEILRLLKQIAPNTYQDM